MTLSAGQSLSFYEILGPLGAGAMGEVYRAKDTRIDREVAIKVLPEEFAGDEERLRRFEREARTLASLNHTNFGGIHNVDQALPRRDVLQSTFWLRKDVEVRQLENSFHRRHRKVRKHA